MRAKRILSLFAALICVFCLAIPAFGNPYQESHGQGYSEYQYGSHGSQGMNQGSGTGGAGTGGLYPGSGSGAAWPGSNNLPNGIGNLPGSGVSNPNSGYGAGNTGGNNSMPGSGVNNHGGGVGSAGGGGGSGYGGSGSSSTGEHFDASFSGGGISIKLPGAEGVTNGDPSSAISLIFEKYKKIGIGITGVCTITAILSLLFQITKLGSAGDNERVRAQALKGIIYSGAVIAVFGSLTLVVGIFWNAFV